MDAVCPHPFPAHAHRHGSAYGIAVLPREFREEAQGHYRCVPDPPGSEIPSIPIGLL
eukprot:gene10366-biopygen425